MKLTTITFATCFVVGVGAGWAHLDAGPEPDGPARQLARQEATIGGARIAVSLDRERVRAGDPLVVTLARIERPDGAGDTALRVALLEEDGSMMSRSMPPPREVMTREVTLGARPVMLSLALAGKADDEFGAEPADPLKTAGSATRYTIVVTAARPVDGAGIYLPAFAYRPEAFQLSIETPAAGKDEDVVELAVRVKSLAKATLEGINLSVSSSLFTITDRPRLESLAPGEEVVVRVTGKRVALPLDNMQADAPPLVLPPLVLANGWAEYGGTATAWASLDPDSGKRVRGASEPPSQRGLMY